MTEEELKKLAKEYQDGLDEVEEVRREFNERFVNLSEAEFVEEYSKYLAELLEDVIREKTRKK